MDQAIHPDNTATATGADAAPKPKKQHGRRILAAFKSATKGGVETVLGTDRLKAAAGAEHAKNRLGVLKSGPDAPSGPIDFPCRYKGKKGHAYITATATSPALSWTTEKEDIDPVFSIAIADIQVRDISGRIFLTVMLTSTILGNQESRRIGMENQIAGWMGDIEGDRRRTLHH